MRNSRMKRADVLAGAVYSLFNARQRILDGCCLLEAKSASGAAMMAILAREELGRHGLLLKHAVRMNGDDVISAAQLNDECSDHVRKLKLGQTSVQIPLPPELLDRFKELCSTPGMSEKDGVMDAISKLARCKRKRDPDDAHLLRLRSQYVNARDDGGWDRPDTITMKEAAALLHTVSADYGNHNIAFWNAPTAKDAIPEASMLYNYNDVMDRVIAAISAVHTDGTVSEGAA